MTARMAIGVPIAAVITVMLALLMQQLIVAQFEEPAEILVGPVIEFLRIPTEPDVQNNIRDPLERPENKPEPPTPAVENVIEKLPGSIGVRISVLDTRGGAGIGLTPTDRDVLPTVRVPPVYPLRAKERGIEGWVQVSFSVSKSGTTYDTMVVAAEPRGYFEQVSIRAIRKFKYKPKVVGGKSVEQHGIEYMFTFELEK